MNVLSLFDGCAMAYEALKRANIPIDTYYASEIDKYAIKIAMKNHPDIVQLGDIQTINPYLLPKIDIIIGGSPCQDVSAAGKGAGISGARSGLFFDFVRLLQVLKPKYFILENVSSMSALNRYIMTQHIGVEPVEIDSALVSAQSRKRLYWSNIPITQPEDRFIFWGVIRQHNLEYLYYSDKALAWIERHSKRTGKTLRIWKDTDKAQMLEASMYKNYSAQRFFGIQDIGGLRYISPIECERLQTLPDNYTEGVSNTQRYKMLGNGFTVDVIAHILRGINGKQNS